MGELTNRRLCGLFPVASQMKTGITLLEEVCADFLPATLSPA